MTLEEKEPNSESFWSQFWQDQLENAKLLAIAFGLAVVIRLFIAEPRYIPSSSMVPTLQIGDRVVVEKVSYYLHQPKTGDIIVFSTPLPLQALGYGKNQAFIKRVVGTPGQTVQVQDGQVYLDGEPVAEDYILESLDYDLAPKQVPDGQLFVMGDNRNNSNDSHVWGFLPEQNVIGRALFRFWPPEQIGSVG